MTANGKTQTVEERLTAAGISREELADYVWGEMERRIRSMLGSMAKSMAADRQALLCAIAGGLCVRMGPANETPQMVAELAERIVDAVLREEVRRAGQ